MTHQRDNAANPIPERKRTTLGLYMTAREAFDMWKYDPRRVRIVDVRTPEEYLFVGHGAMAANVPIAFVGYRWDPARNQPAMEPNPDFISAAKRLFRSTDTLLVMCRSGGRSAVAVDALATARFNHVYNIVDGMEGDALRAPGSALDGRRMKNGWKNSGIPWTYEIDPALMWTSPRRSQGTLSRPPGAAPS
jgi:rhodanese-related sulfurtransferase